MPASEPSIAVIRLLQQHEQAAEVAAVCRGFVETLAAMRGAQRDAERRACDERTATDAIVRRKMKKSRTQTFCEWPIWANFPNKPTQTRPPVLHIYIDSNGFISSYIQISIY